MNRLLRWSMTVVVLSGLAINLLPSSGFCQMTPGTLFAKSCPMPCCKAKLPMRNCPMMKAAPARDFIANTAPVFESTLEPMHLLSSITPPLFKPIVAALIRFGGTLQLLFSGPPSSVRAPPSDPHLTNA